MNRRDFIKGLTAAVGTVAVASTAVAALDVVSVPNIDAVAYGYNDAGNGWYRVWKTWEGNMQGGFTLDFGEDGMYLTPNSMAQLEQSSPENMTFSCYVKCDPETVLEYTNLKRSSAHFS